MFSAVWFWFAEHERAADRMPAGGESSVRDAGEFAAFAAWCSRIDPVTVAGGELARGIELARRRLAVLESLARSAPAVARSRMMGLEALAALPSAVRAECEEPWSAVADFELRWETRVDDEGVLACRHQHIVTGEGISAEAFGAHLTGATRPLSREMLQGHRIGRVLLIDEDPARALDAAEVAAATLWFPQAVPAADPLTGADAANGIAAVVGGRIERFESAETLAAVREALREGAVEARRDGLKTAIQPFSVLADNGPGGGGPVEPTPVMGNALDVLFIRVDFSDFAGEAKSISKAELTTTLGSVAGTLNQYSYGAATLNFTVSDKLYRMPASGASYAVAGNNNGIRDAARALAAADFNLSAYDVVAVYFPSLSGVSGSLITYGGLAGVGYGDHWLNGSKDHSVIAHEFGHNYGLLHANYWNPSATLGGARYDDPVFGSVEYGDIFDLMGQGVVPDSYFSPFATHRLGWLSPEKVITPTSSGTFRIHRFDTPGATSHPVLALRVPMGGGVHYWVGHRKRYGSPFNLSSAAYVVAEGLYEGRPNLIDMTPGSNPSAVNDRRDCGLAVGAVFHDTMAGVRFETIASGGAAPNEWIDVNLQFEPRIELAETLIEVDEAAGVAHVTLRRNFSNGTAASVQYGTANGTATAGADYLAVSGTAAWAANDVSDKTLAVPIRPDTLAEGVETLQFNLTSPGGAVISPGRGSATIRVLDPGRRFNGFAPGFFNTTVDAVVPLPDGKVIIGGIIGAGISSTLGIRHIARLHADGTVDSDFLTGLGFDGPVTDMVRQADGRIVVAGNFTSYDGTPCNRLIRLNPNGTADTAFVTAYGSGPNAGINALALDRDGKILIAGDFTSFGGTTAKKLVRLLPSGARDTLTVDALLAVNWIDAVVALPDGKILIGGSVNTGYAAPPIDGFRSGLARLNANGSRDATFEIGAGGHSGPRNSLAAVTAIARQPDGKLVVGGAFTSWNGAAATRLVRLNENGARDATFTAAAFDSAPLGLLVQPAGQVVVCGFFTTPGEFLTRLTSAGAVDASWNPGGNPSAPVYTVARDTAGALIAGGNFFDYAGTSSRPVIRLAGGGGDAYDAWKLANFTAAQLAESAANPGSDPDGDGYTNLLELAAGTSPTTITTTPVASGATTVTHGGQRYLQLEFAKGPDAVGLWFGGQFSSTPGGWAPASPAPGSNATYTVIEDSPARLILRDNTPVSAGSRRFGRIHIKRPQ